MPGRILSYELGPLNYRELAKNFDLDKALSRGLLPGIWLEEDKSLAEKTLKTYSLTYLKEEVQAEALTRNLEGFSRFFEVIASRWGSLVDFSKFSSEAMIERTTASRYFDTLVDTLILESIEPFTKSQKRRLIQHPKYYFFDVGVLNGCLDNFQISADRKGLLLENLILQLIKSSAKAKDETVRISYYRTSSNAEVDFIIERKNEVFAVEIKSSKKLNSKDLTGLKSFAEFYKKKHHSIVVYLGDEDLKIGRIEVLTIDSFMKKLGYS